MRPELPPNLRDQSPEQVGNMIQQLIQQRSLIYVSPNVEITGDVITRLDAKYKAGGK